MALIENKFVVIGSFSNSIYSDILLNYLDEKNTLMELGGGYGKFAYYIQKKKIILILISICRNFNTSFLFLSKCFPKKKFLLW